MSFRQQFVTALYRFGSYFELAKVKGWRTILYTVILAVFTVFIMLARLAPVYINVGGFSGMAERYLPDFTITDGTLEMDKYERDDSEDGVKILVDTSRESFNLSDAGDSNLVFLAGSKECYMFNGVQGVKMAFADLETDISKTEIVKSLSRSDVKLGIISGLALLFFISCIMLAIYNIAVIALLGNIINMLIVRTPVGFSQILKLASYSRTLPYILSIVVPLVCGFMLNPIVFYAVAVFYVYKGLKSIKAQAEFAENAEAE
jgi:hypothetical protein